MSPVKKKKNKSSKASAFSVRLGYILGAIFMFLLLFQMVQFSELRGKLNFIDGLQESQSAVVEQVSLSQSYLTQFATDLNQIREFLLLPQSDYDFEDLGEVNLEIEDEDLTTQIFEFIDALGKAEANAALFESEQAHMLTFVNSDFFSTYGQELVNPAGLGSVDYVQWQIRDIETQAITLTINLNYDGTWEGYYYHKNADWAGKSAEAIETELRDFYANELTNLVSVIAQVAASNVFLDEVLFPSEDFQNYIVSHSLDLSENAWSYDLLNADKTVLARFEVVREDGSLSLIIYGANQEEIELSLDETGKSTALSSLNELVDPRTNLVMQVDEHREELSQLMQDRGFISTLEALGLSMGEVIEEETRLYYSIMNAEGIVLRNLVLDFATGDVSVEMPDSGESESLAVATLILQESSKKKRSTYLI